LRPALRYRLLQAEFQQRLHSALYLLTPGEHLGRPRRPPSPRPRPDGRPLPPPAIAPNDGTGDRATANFLRGV